MPWHGHLDLAYRIDQSSGAARCIVADRHDGPLRVLAALRPEAPTVCHSVLVHPPGGMAGGDRLDLNITMDERAHALIIRHHNRASTAITFIAAFLGAAKAAIQPQPIQQGLRRRSPRHAHGRTIQVKRNIGHRRNLPPSPHHGPSSRAGACRPMRRKAGTRPRFFR